MLFKRLKQQATSIFSNEERTAAEKMAEICELLRDGVAPYDWVGFYFANHDARTLHLGAYAGQKTDHTVIPFGKGICGQVAVSNDNFIVPDVKAQDNYIACSITVKAEIVLPIFKDGVNIGQIDIDSNTPDPFTTEDEKFLEWVCKQVASCL